MSTTAMDPRQDREAIAALIHCYARANDTIGDATTNADPVAAALPLYRECLADDVEIQAWFPHLPVSAQAFPDPARYPDTAPAVYRGREAWARHVNEVFRARGCSFTQHAISNVEVTVEGDRGRLTAYLIATLVSSGRAVGDPSKSLSIANGTYSVDAVRTQSGWRIRRMYVTLIAFNTLLQP